MESLFRHLIMRRFKLGKTRLEAFSDGVIAIIITVMVLVMKVPHGDNFASLQPLISVFISYLLSFIFVGIYWINHHHLMHAVDHVNGPALWANMHLLFWLSLVPFATGWMGENHFHAIPVALYGVLLLMTGIAYSLLVYTLVKHHGKNSALAKIMGKDLKSNISLVAYALAIPLAFVNQLISMGLYVAVAAMWFLPDRRIESLPKS